MMLAEIEKLAALRHAPKQSADVAAYLAGIRAGRAWEPVYPPVVAAPVRRCAGCGSRDGWVWSEPRPGAGQWACGACA